MKRRTSRIAAVALSALFLAGCGTTLRDTMHSITRVFSGGGKKSKLKGERISILTLSDELKPDPTLADVPVVLPPPYVNKNWPEPGGYASNALYHLEADGPLRQIWEADAGQGSNDKTRLTASPIVADGHVYVLDAEANLIAFDAATGKRLWHENLAPKGRRNIWNVLTFGTFGTNTKTNPQKGFGGGVAFDGGRLFATTGFGDVIALDPQGGKELWRTNVGVPIINAPVVNGGRVFVSSQDNHFYGIAASNGRILWDHQGITEPAGILESTSAAVAGEFVIAPYTSGELYALRVQNGQPAWSDMLTRTGQRTALSELDDIAGRPVVDRDMVFAISHSGVMAAISLNTGERVWSRDLTGIDTPWAAGDFLYVLSTDQQLLCLRRKDGRVKWLHQLPRLTDPTDPTSDAVVWAGPVLVSNRLIVVSSDGYAESISPYDGRLLGRMEIPAAAYIPPVVANGTLYLLTNDAELVALR